MSRSSRCRRCRSSACSGVSTTAPKIIGAGGSMWFEHAPHPGEICPSAGWRQAGKVDVLMLSSMIRGEVIEYLDTGKLLAKDVEDEDIMFARPGPAVEYWEGED